MQKGAVAADDHGEIAAPANLVTRRDRQSNLGDQARGIFVEQDRKSARLQVSAQDHDGFTDVRIADFTDQPYGLEIHGPVPA
jgi:hypothetical protein